MGRFLIVLGTAWFISLVYLCAWLSHIDHWAFTPTYFTAFLGFVICIAGGIVETNRYHPNNRSNPNE